MNHLVSRDLADIATGLVSRAAVHLGSFARADASQDEAEAGFLRLISDHRRTIVLEAEFRAAERALAAEMNDENWARLQAIHKQLQNERPEISDEVPEVRPA